MTVAGGEVTFTSRNGNDLTERFRDVARAAQLAIRTADAVLDGEICALDEHGRSRFSLLQEGNGHARARRSSTSSSSTPSRSSTSRSQERRRRLERRRRRGRGRRSSRLSSTTATRCSRRRASRSSRASSRSAADSQYQLRTPRDRLAEAEVATHARRSSSPATRAGRAGARRFGALVAGVHDAGGLRWAGNVGTGFSDAEIERLRKRHASRSSARTRRSPTCRGCPAFGASDVVWVEPNLVAEVEFAEWTHEGRLRAPSYLRLARRQARHRRCAASARRSLAMLKRGRRSSGCGTSTSRSGPTRASRRATSSPTTATSPRCSSRTCEDRPFTMKRYPDGWQGKHFFQKQAPSHMPEWIERAPFSLRRPARARRRSSTTRSWTTTSRSCGWRTWAASTCTRGRLA